jgi:tetratricopeptide (TPR) repeat protein/tRNA A-37 threonylcarbamoyl transferase component Bud32
MDPARLQQIQDLYHSAVEHAPSERAAFLKEACGLDAELRREVESLLAQNGSSDGPMDRPAISLFAEAMVAQVSAGDLLGPYRIESLLGEGGMGQVYKARDTRLGRTVAIKISSRQFSERFEREARAISSLNHTNICTLFDVGPNYLVMEYVEGAPIAGTDDLHTLLDQAMQVADGMAAAHALGITHRDLKPGNILVTRAGQVKILDFGLAQVERNAQAAEPDATATMSLTELGTTLGAVAYMSPEQARGIKVDARSDLWSLGVILYEMATGTRPFQGPTAPMVFEGILTKAPAPVREKNPKIPVELERIIARLLEKDRETRYQSAADVRADLKRLERASSASGAVAPEPKARVPLKYAIAAAVAAVLIAGGAFWWQRAHTRPLTDQDVLVMADFTNTSGDTAFDGALRQALAFELEKSPVLKIMDDQEVNQTLQLMGRPAGQRITNDIAHEVCIREDQKATLDGSIASFGKTYQIVLQVINCQTGATLAREQAEAEDKEHVLKAVANAATAMRAKLGESLRSIQKPERYVIDAPVATTSLEALKAYHLGGDLISRDSPREAIPELQRAIELDPNFASAYDLLFVAYSMSGDYARLREAISKTFALRDHVSEDERLAISGDYYQFVTHDLGRALDTYQVEARTYPRNAAPHNSLRILYDDKGEHEKALQEAQEALRLAPRIGPFFSVVVTEYMVLDRFDEAKSYAEKAFSRNMATPTLHNLLLRIAFIQNNHSAQDREIQWLAGKPEEINSLQLQALNAIMHGQRRKANELSQRVNEVARRQGLTGAQGDTDGLPPAVVDAWLGDCDSARKDKSNPFLDVCGDAAAVRLADEQTAKNPPPNPDNVFFLYLRGLAGLRAGKGAEAAAEFRKILDHKGLNSGPLYSLAYLGLARAEALAGDTARAKKTYQGFLALRKDADPDLPTLIAARKEYAALK